MLATSADLPIEGRAAMTIRLPGWKPPVMSSMSLNPDGVPVSDVLDTDSRWSLSVSSWRMSAIVADLLLAVVVSDLEHQALGALHQVSRRRLAAEHAGLDLVGGGQQRAHLRVVAHDPAVLARVTGRRDPAGQLVDRLRPADFLELAAVAQHLGDGQVIDLAVGVVELDHGREHRTVLLAVEVLGPQVLLDQQSVQVPLVEQDRAEHRLLGLEIVGWYGDGLDGAHRVSESRFAVGVSGEAIPQDG